MKYEPTPFYNLIPECFAFYNSSGILHKKF